VLRRPAVQGPCLSNLVGWQCGVVMRWLEQLRRRRTERKQHRDERKKQYLRPRIAEEVRAVVPKSEPILVQAIGDVNCAPMAQPIPPWPAHDRLAAWRSSRPRQRAYIIATDQHLILLRQRSQGERELSVPLASIGKATCHRTKPVYAPMVYSNVWYPAHVQLWIDLGGGAQLRLKMFRPWLSEAEDLCRTLRAEPTGNW
jgi:hypothetical protein